MMLKPLEAPAFIELLIRIEGSELEVKCLGSSYSMKLIKSRAVCLLTFHCAGGSTGDL